MHLKKPSLIILLLSLINCSGFKPLYKENIKDIYKLQSFVIIADQKKISQKIRKELISIFPANKNSKYIIKIEAKSETSGTVSDITRKISRYKVEISATVKIYHRKKKYDKLIYYFDEKREAPYSLVLNNIRTTLASKNKAEETAIRLLTEEIQKTILIYMANN